MLVRLFFILIIFNLFISCKEETKTVVEDEVIVENERFDIKNDFLLLNYDCKTDVDDLHSIAAFATYKTVPESKDLKWHAVAGAYGVQGGLYVPPNTLFELAFPGQWSDAHSDYDKAVDEVKAKVSSTLSEGGNLWIAEAGQSDFSAALIKALAETMNEVVFAEKINIVQHSEWNESVTDSSALAFVKSVVNYHKIPDGNAIGNGTPGFRSDEKIDVSSYLESEHLKDVWNEAITLANQYNGKEGRYLNESMEAGGLDFSDFSEVCWIMGMEDLHDGKAFFEWVKTHRMEN